MNDQVLNIDGQEYEFVPQEARVLTTYLFTLYDRLGLRSDITVADLSPGVWKFIDQVFITWKVGYPHEYQEWVENLQFELKYERPIQEAIKKGGYTPMSYPQRAYDLIRVFLPNIKLQDKYFIKQLVKRIPELKMTNYRL